MTAVQIADHRIVTPSGGLFARTWSPAGPACGVPVILFHDSLGCVELWREFPAKLAARTQRTVIAYDRLGFGQSDPHPPALDPEFVQTESKVSIPALRQQLGIDRFVAFGYSVGGAMSVLAAGDHPDACVAVITVAAQAFLEERTFDGILRAKAAFQEPGQMQRLERVHGSKARWVLDAWVNGWFAPDKADWRLDEYLMRVHCPLLILHGDSDEYGSVLQPECFDRLTPGPSRVVILDNCGHVPHREQEGRVLREVEQFLAPLEGGR
jgi:pimeloyl-ACP methyl ester carboxylesterase